MPRADQPLPKPLERCERERLRPDRERSAIRLAVSGEQQLIGFEKPEGKAAGVGYALRSRPGREPLEALPAAPDRGGSIPRGPQPTEVVVDKARERGLRRSVNQVLYPAAPYRASMASPSS